jgi:hypothetical protein
MIVKMFKKACVSMHPGVWFIIGLILGAVLIYLMAKGIIPGLNIC